VHWYKDINNLRREGALMGYTLQHYLHCMQRFIGFFNPNLQAMTQDLEAVQLARFLLRLTVPDSPKDDMIRELKMLVRQPNEPIREVMNTLHVLAQMYYRDKPALERDTLVNRFMTSGLTQFTTGQTKKSLIANINYSTAINRPQTWQQLLQSVNYSERVNGLPTTQLKFSAADPENISFFHSTFMPVELNDPVSPMPVQYDLDDYDHHAQDNLYSPRITPITTPGRPVVVQHQPRTPRPEQIRTHREMPQPHAEKRSASRSPNSKIRPKERKPSIEPRKSD